MDANPFLSVVIPAYNEETRIGATLDTIYSYLSRQAFSWEVLIVLDGPEDNTLDVVRTFAQGKRAIRWLDRRENRGKGYTVREGMLAARGAVRLFTDADNSTDISHFEQMRPLFDTGYQVVIASRDGKDAPGATQVVRQPLLKRLLGNLANLFIQVVAVPGLWDTQCGFKAFTAEAAERIFSLCRIDGWAFDIEALALARHLDFDIAVVPARWVDDADTHVTPSSYLKTLSDPIRVRWNFLRGRYATSTNKPDSNLSVSGRQPMTPVGQDTNMSGGS